MEGTIRFTKADCVPDTACVCHYDELDESAKERFPVLVESTRETSEPHLVASFERYDYVKFTRLYRVHSTPCSFGASGMD